ncbi:MAG: DUF177 domain-containing protein [Clostridium sp.]|nr:DUF177 domain-containing protein [Acetatifactor muris]MCM1527705.1 DUF177 domain-containing protein [Bacteroides sp.]MCM1563966.1 DUF177 domain-containing protein [Clostridium sp.]
MLVNLSDVLTTEGKVVTGEFPLEMTAFADGAGSFEVAEKSPVALTLTNIGEGKARVEGECHLSFTAVCDRCLAETPVAMDLLIDRTVYAPDAVAEDEETDADDLRIMEGYQLNVETLVYDEIIVNRPVKILCREDCKGVCPVCGQNLNERECGCDTFVPDPRMAAIQDIFDANKEV